jgi:hypothetical protein
MWASPPLEYWKNGILEWKNDSFYFLALSFIIHHSSVPLFNGAEIKGMLPKNYNDN